MGWMTISVEPPARRNGCDGNKVNSRSSAGKPGNRGGGQCYIWKLYEFGKETSPISCALKWGQRSLKRTDLVLVFFSLTIRPSQVSVRKDFDLVTRRPWAVHPPHKASNTCKNRRPNLRTAWGWALRPHRALAGKNWVTNPLHWLW